MSYPRKGKRTPVGNRGCSPRRGVHDLLERHLVVLEHRIGIEMRLETIAIASDCARVSAFAGTCKSALERRLAMIESANEICLICSPVAALYGALRAKRFRNALGFAKHSHLGKTYLAAKTIRYFHVDSHDGQPCVEPTRSCGHRQRPQFALTRRPYPFGFEVKVAVASPLAMCRGWNGAQSVLPAPRSRRSM